MATFNSFFISGAKIKLFSFLALLIFLSLNCASSEDDQALADAVKRESEALQREVQDMMAAKQFDRAIEVLRERGSKWLSRYGAKSWPMAEISTQLADTYLACRCGKEDEAAELYEKAASVKLELYGDSHPRYAAAVEKAADALVNAGSYRQAMSYFKKLTKKVLVGLGEDHEALTNVRMKLADCAMRAKSYKTAKKAFSQLLQGKPSDENAAHIQLNLAVAMTHLGDNAGALEHVEKAKDLSARHFGKQDMRYAKALNAVGGILERLNRDKEALRSMQEAAEIVSSLLGSKDPMALQAQRNIEGIERAIRAKQSLSPSTVV